MTTGSRTSVMIADDHRMIVYGLRETITLAEGLEVAGCAHDGDDAVDLYFRTQPDVAILDICMPSMDGITATRAIKARDSNARILLFTAFEDDQSVRQALEAGAMGFLLKTATDADVIASILAVMAGRRFVATAVAQRLANWHAGDTLTRRELHVLHLVAQGHRNKAVARSVGVTEGTIKAHLKNIFKKLCVSSRTEAVHTAIRQGLMRAQ